MEEIPGRLVIRSQSPGRRWLLLSTAVLLALVGLYVAFELGRYLAGYDAVRAAADRAAMQRQIDQLQQTQHRLRVQLAAAQESQISDTRERSEVSRTIGELQAQLERQQKDVEFYRALLAPQLGQQTNSALRVQQFHITALPVAQQFLLRFTLNRLMQPERSIDGTLEITVAGTRNGAPDSVGFALLTGGKSGLPFNFRYYMHIEQPITLPVAFKPDSVTIEVRPSRKGMAPYRQTFLWEVDPI